MSERNTRLPKPIRAFGLRDQVIWKCTPLDRIPAIIKGATIWHRSPLYDIQTMNGMQFGVPEAMLEPVS